MYLALVASAGVLVVVANAPSWVALVAGLAIALVFSRERAPSVLPRLTTIALQLGVVALGAGMNLVTVWHVGASGAAVTALTLGVAIALGLALGRAFGVGGDTPLLVAVGTAVCGGSAIAAVASVIRPKEHELSVSLAVVFVLNAVGLIVFPLVGRALGLGEPAFGRWAALAIHDTSSVVGAGLAYGPIALSVATSTKLARALWIVPVTLVIALTRGDRDATPTWRARLRAVRWPWFILGFVAVASAFTWIAALAPIAHTVVLVGQRTLVLALYLIGLSMSRDAIARVGARPLVLGVVLWVIVAAISLPLAAWLA